MPIKSRILLPHPELRQFVSSYILLENPHFLEYVETCPPMVGMGVAFMDFGENPMYWRTKNGERPLPMGYIIPPMTYGCSFIGQEIGKGLLIHFKPGMSRHFMDLPFRELLNIQYSIEELGLGDWYEMQLRFREISLLKFKSELEEFMMRKLYKQDLQIQLLDQCLQFLMSTPSHTISELGDRSGFSTRYLRKVFRRDLGLSPKEFQRVYQFNIAFNLFRQGAYTSLADIAFQAGYYDQAHFCKACREFLLSNLRDFDQNSLNLALRVGMMPSLDS